MIVNFIEYAKTNKPNLLQPWYDSSDGGIRIRSITTANRYLTKTQATEKDKQDERRSHNNKVLNQFGIYK